MKNIFLSEITRHRVIIFGMYHHLVDIYQFCSNYVPGAKTDPALGSHVLHRLIIGKHKKTFSKTTRPKALIFGKWHT